MRRPELRERGGLESLAVSEASTKITVCSRSSIWNPCHRRRTVDVVTSAHRSSVSCRRVSCRHPRKPRAFGFRWNRGASSSKPRVRKASRQSTQCRGAPIGADQTVACSTRPRRNSPCCGNPPFRRASTGNRSSGGTLARCQLAVETAYMPSQALPRPAGLLQEAFQLTPCCLCDDGLAALRVRRQHGPAKEHLYTNKCHL